MKILGFEGDNKVLLNQLLALTLRISKYFDEFSKNYLIEIMLKNSFHGEDVLEVKAQLLSEVSLPFIVKTDIKTRSTS